MTYRELTEKLLALEEEFDLFGRTVAGVLFWDLVRRRVHGAVLVKEEMVPAHVPERRGLARFVRMAFGFVWIALFKNPFLVSRADIVVFGSDRRRLQEDGLWHDIYCDSLIDRLEQEGMRCLMVENPPLGGELARRPIKTRRTAHLSVIQASASVLFRLRPVRLSLSGEERAFLKLVETRLARELGVRVRLQAMLEDALGKARATSPFYKAFLRKSAPRAVVVVKPMGKRSLITACRELGIPVVELQYSDIHRSNLAYSYEGPKRVQQGAPDYLFLFGDFWKRNVSFSLPKERVFAVGFPYYEQERAKYANLKKRRGQILFLSKPIAQGALSRFAIEVARELGDAWHIVYKLYERESMNWKERYPWLADSGIEVVAEGEQPLYELFAESEVQVSGDSTAVYEGVGFGLRTFLLELPGTDNMEPLVKSGHAELVASAHQLKALLEHPRRVQRETKEEFFKKNALGYMTSLIKKLCVSGAIRQAE
ncbi:MAG: hypothetical protein A3D64_01385 [Candidatus Wildermuthbacteria bacterium RIFCSPHIGHO2_02_FULL_49_9]|uniref:Uncharacterized protein n=1 Tax=Candidatus Wildermuthbacteria bacterium RIFCSPHIGHO2_02_FULL_49_9 TaxID=1802456 RepID=A0A1G2REE5_9BACT|nr:MAG: hypothetical protein A3D64_01385 [Candidatus Wildermuthbacteria bacterium RIFCSPHIGHO2_02_FULL_49_9]